MRGFFADVGERNLVRAECALDGGAVNFFGAGPAFWSAQDDHGPGPQDGFAPRAVCPRVLLNRTNFRVAAIECGGQLLMDDGRIVACDEIWRVAVTLKLCGEFFVAGTRRHGGPGNFVTVHMEDWKHRAIARGVQEFHALPTSFEWAGFRFAIADNAG